MIRQFEEIVTAGTTSNSPLQTRLKLCKGMLSKVTVIPANGPNWEVYFRLLHLENAIIPDSNDEWIPLERELLTFYPDFNEWKNIYSVTIEFCSPQARFDHNVQVILEVAEKQGILELLGNLLEKGF